MKLFLTLAAGIVALTGVAATIVALVNRHKKLYY